VNPWRARSGLRVRAGNQTEHSNLYRRISGEKGALSKCLTIIMKQFLLAGLIIPMAGLAQDLARSWYPIQPGDTWVYQKESLDGYMAHPSIESWTTEESIVGTIALPDLPGTLVTRRTKVLAHTVPPDFIPQNDSTRRELAESHILIYRNAVYVLDGADAEGSACDPNIFVSPCLRPLDPANHLRREYVNDLHDGKIPPDFRFPMRVGEKWGKVPITSPAGEWVWYVAGLSADPFGPPRTRTYHLTSHLGSGTMVDLWFTEGVGVVQEVMEHHGTYDERRRKLLRSTIGGTTRTYQLTPARTMPLSDEECSGPGWQHFVRPDGTAFTNMRDCIDLEREKRTLPH
jgi:hypothetical protein